MKRSVALLAALALTANAEPPSIRDLLRDGLYAEEISRDKDAAAKHYEQIVTQFDEQRPFAANALFRLAEIRRAQNRKDDAIALYQRVLTQFPDADPQANLARAQLAALGGKLPDNSSTALVASDDPETRELQRLQILAITSPDLLRTPETCAELAKKGWVRPIAYLLDQASGADTGVQFSMKYNIMYQAAISGHLGIVQLLLARGTKPQSGITTFAIEGAASAGHIEIVRALLDAGTSPDGRQSGGLLQDLTPLSAAAGKGNLEIAKLLIAKGADVNLASPGYLGPLSNAINQSNPSTQVIDLLLANKADVNLPDPEFKVTPIWLAARNGNASLVKRLLELGADPAAESSDTKQQQRPDFEYEGKSTPLERAVAANSVESQGSYIRERSCSR